MKRKSSKKQNSQLLQQQEQEKQEQEKQEQEKQEQEKQEQEKQEQTNANEAESKFNFSSLNASVRCVRFFESGFDVPPLGERSYKTTFVSSQTRYICWELYLDIIPESPRRYDFKVDAVYYNSNGDVVASQTLSAYVEKGWLDSQHAFGWGSQEEGSWPPGWYRVALSIEGKPIASQSFEVI